MPSSGAIVGAIRWDAWYDPQSMPGKAVQGTLSPAHYHFRLPFFARIGTNVEIDGSSVDALREEIDFAERAGLSYWAFCAYPPSSGMSTGLAMYLEKSRYNRLNFCMLSGIDVFAHSEIVDWHLSLMMEDRYQTLQEQRPLYFIGFYDHTFVDRQWGGLGGLRVVLDDFRRTVMTKGRNWPYFVWLGRQDGREAERDAEIALALGCDALSAYAVNHNRRSASYAELVREAKEVWEAQAATGMPVVPIITTGFDRRPRFEYPLPLPWEPRKKPASPDEMMIYYETATPAEIERAIKDCLAWLAANQQAAPAQAALIYAWNENDEGGWLIPTYPDNRERIEATRRALCID